MLFLQWKIEYMLKLVKEYKRKKLLRNLLKPQSPVIQNLRDVHSVGIIFVASSNQALEEAQTIVDELKKQKFSFCGAVVEYGKCFKSAVEREEYILFCNSNGIDFISRDSVNWIGKPDDDAVPEFLGRHFNLFISLNNCNSFTVDYLTQKADAECIVGMRSNSGMPYTLIMEPVSRDFSFSSYLNGLFDFLKRVNA